jgi:hypothetical protein
VPRRGNADETVGSDAVGEPVDGPEQPGRPAEHDGQREDLIAGGSDLNGHEPQRVEQQQEGRSLGLPEPAAGQQEPTGRQKAARSPTTRADLVAAALIVVVAVGAALTLWYHSDARATTSQTNLSPAPVPASPSALPATLAEVWRAPSAATTEPVVAGPSVVTGDGGDVVGRDPVTGQVRWRYARNNLELCTVIQAWGKALAAYHRAHNCSEITALDAASGALGPQRNSEAGLGARLLYDGNHVTVTGRSLLDVWRSDLVRTTYYGQLSAPVNPGKQPRAGCTYSSVAVTSGRIGVVERCPDDPAARITVLKTEHAENDEDKPEQYFSTVLGSKNARVVALSGDHTAVLLADSGKLAVFDGSGNEIAEYPLNLPASDLAGDPSGMVVPTTVGPNAIYWFTGSSTIALSTDDLHPLWTVDATLGSGTLFAGRLLLPVPAGLQVVDPGTGATIGTFPVDRRGYSGPVQLSSLGPVVLEQRGNTVVALR